MAHNVQQYDKTQFLRVDEAQRCRVHSALLMPLYTSTARRHPFGVFEVVQADTDVLFPVLVQWLKHCLQVSLHSSCKQSLSCPVAEFTLQACCLHIMANLLPFVALHSAAQLQIVLHRKCSCTQLSPIRMP